MRSNSFGEQSDFVAGTDVDAGREVSPADPCRALPNRQDWSGEVTCQRETRADRNQDRGEEHGQRCEE